MELWARMLSGNFAEMTTSTLFRNLLHAANLRHGTEYAYIYIYIYIYIGRYIIRKRDKSEEFRQKIASVYALYLGRS